VLGVGHWELGVGCCLLVITLNYLVLLEVYLINVSKKLAYFFMLLCGVVTSLIMYKLVIFLDLFAQHELFGLYFLVSRFT
jgi:hypothetical protein